MHDEDPRDISNEPVTIGRYLNQQEAIFAKGVLESAGIECYLVDQNMNRIEIPILIGGVRLQVRRGDAADALALLDTAAPAD